MRGGLPQAGVDLLGLVDRSSCATSVTEPSGTGTRIAMPSTLPANSGKTRAVALRGSRAGRNHRQRPARPRRRLRVGLSMMDWLVV